MTEKPEILFARLDAREVAEKAEAMFEARKAAPETEQEQPEEESGIDIEPKEEITYDMFDKMQFRVGEIIACEEVPKSKSFSAPRFVSEAR